jgi:hypothetical protein
LFWALGAIRGAATCQCRFFYQQWIKEVSKEPEAAPKHVPLLEAAVIDVGFPLMRSASILAPFTQGRSSCLTGWPTRPPSTSVPAARIARGR